MPKRPGILRLSWIALAGLWMLATGGPAMAQGLGDLDEGHRLATLWCSSCHVVDRAAQSGTSTGAPPFPAIAQNKALTPLSLQVFLQTPHDRMPDLHLTRNESDDLIAYILSLRQ